MINVYHPCLHVIVKICQLLSILTNTQVKEEGHRIELICGVIVHSIVRQNIHKFFCGTRFSAHVVANVIRREKKKL